MNERVSSRNSERKPKLSVNVSSSNKEELARCEVKMGTCDINPQQEVHERRENLRRNQNGQTNIRRRAGRMMIGDMGRLMARAQ